MNNKMIKSTLMLDSDVSVNGKGMQTLSPDFTLLPSAQNNQMPLSVSKVLAVIPKFSY